MHLIVRYHHGSPRREPLFVSSASMEVGKALWTDNRDAAYEWDTMAAAVNYAAIEPTLAPYQVEVFESIVTVNAGERKLPDQS